MVISIDSNPKVKPTIVADIRYLPLRENLRPERVHASPPCKYFSEARFRHFGYNEAGLAESLRIVAACFDAFYYLKPKHWTLENPRGLLTRIIGWHQSEVVYDKYDFKAKRTHFWSNNLALKRAMIPQDIKQKILSLVNTENRDIC